MLAETAEDAAVAAKDEAEAAMLGIINGKNAAEAFAVAAEDSAFEASMSASAAGNSKDTALAQ